MWDGSLWFVGPINVLSVNFCMNMYSRYCTGCNIVVLFCSLSYVYVNTAASVKRIILRHLDQPVSSQALSGLQWIVVPICAIHYNIDFRKDLATVFNKRGPVACLLCTNSVSETRHGTVPYCVNLHCAKVLSGFWFPSPFWGLSWHCIHAHTIHVLHMHNSNCDGPSLCSGSRYWYGVSWASAAGGELPPRRRDSHHEDATHTHRDW